MEVLVTPQVNNIFFCQLTCKSDETSPTILYSPCSSRRVVGRSGDTLLIAWESCDLQAQVTSVVMWSYHLVIRQFLNPSPQTISRWTWRWSRNSSQEHQFPKMPEERKKRKWENSAIIYSFSHNLTHKQIYSITSHLQTWFKPEFFTSKKRGKFWSNLHYI